MTEEQQVEEPVEDQAGVEDPRTPGEERTRKDVKRAEAEGDAAARRFLNEQKDDD